MLKKLYDKSKIWFAIVWIIAYCVLMSVGDALSEMIGIEKLITFPVGLLLSVILLVFLKKNGLFRDYGLCASTRSDRSMLYYFPVLIMMAPNIFGGFSFSRSVLEAILYLISMLCVGFLEEIIFRGLLFNAMRKDSLKAAVIVSSVTFGIGHIINLINGSGAELIPNLLQVVYATSAGFMFVMMYYRTNSLLGCIIAHGLFNALGAFVDEAAITTRRNIETCIFLTVVTASYAIYIALMKDRGIKKE